MPSQQATIGPAPMEGVERTNAVVVQRSGIGALPRRDSYAMKIDWERNCYTYGVLDIWPIIAGIEKRGRMMEGRRVEYGGGRIEKINKHSNNLKGVENLEFLD